MTTTTEVLEEEEHGGGKQEIKRGEVVEDVLLFVLVVD